MNDNNIQGRERPAFTVEDSSRQGFSEACAKLEEALLNPALSDEYVASARERIAICRRQWEMVDQQRAELRKLSFRLEHL